MSAGPVRHPSLPFSISTNIDDFDFARLHGWLSGAYWARDIPRDIVEKSFRHSLSFVLLHDTDGAAGCARMITDRATFAYLGDVFIAPAHRGLGLGRWLMDVIMAHPDLQGLRRMMLATSDMHALYAQVGFRPVAKPDILMEIVVPDIYSAKNTQ
ncbi:MAG: N-acetyltransferase [Alphaproteobacteria bacterium]|nr:MAG: N-acetyltransferase [Alphaproteobacteria bacterium]